MPKNLTYNTQADKYKKLSQDQKELLLLAENGGTKDSHLNQYQSIWKNYDNKVKKGNYDYEKSIKGYKNLVTNIRKDSADMMRDSDYKFTPKDDGIVAEMLANEYYLENKKEISASQKKPELSKGSYIKENRPKIKTTGSLSSGGKKQKGFLRVK